MLGKRHADSENLPRGVHGGGIALFQSPFLPKDAGTSWPANLPFSGRVPITTFASYGQVDARRQAEIIRNLGRTRPEAGCDAELVRGIAELVAQHRRGKGVSGRAGT
jgi:hypothetical protein